MSIVVYTTPTCGYCFQLKNYFQQRNIPFAEYDVSQDPYRANEMVRLSGQQGVPVCIVDGQMVLGADIPRINQVLGQRAQRPPKLGVSIADAQRVASKKGIQLPAGAYIGRIHPASAAALAGVHVGDVLVSLNGTPIHNDQDVHRASKALSYDQHVDLEVWRGGQQVRLRAQM